MTPHYHSVTAHAGKGVSIGGCERENAGEDFSKIEGTLTRENQTCPEDPKIQEYGGGKKGKRIHKKTQKRALRGQYRPRCDGGEVT